MSLEALLKPFKAVDEALLKQYTRFSLWVEEKGLPNSKQPLVCIFGTILTSFGLAATLSPGARLSYEDVSPLETVLASSLLILDQFYTPLLFHDWIYSRRYAQQNRSEATSSTISEDQFSYVSKKIQRVLRLPLIMAGGYLGYRGLTNTLDGGSLQQLSLGIMGIILNVGLATSMYLKDTNPKLLDKEPAWKRAYNWLSEKAQSLVHRPVPVPVPTRYNTLPQINNYE